MMEVFSLDDIKPSNKKLKRKYISFNNQSIARKSSILILKFDENNILLKNMEVQFGSFIDKL